jgi:tRNA-Thr(GGU) m(6)t(6)A37 methyltransferase TsaA
MWQTSPSREIIGHAGRDAGQGGPRDDIVGGGEMKTWTMRAVGYVRSPFADAAEIPKGLGAQHEAEGVLEILPEYEAGLTDIDGFSHLIVLWVFDRSEGFELVSTPPSDNRPHGVFASRAPRRPNPLGLSVVRLLSRNGRCLAVRGVDMLDGTPILDIKPYLSNVAAEELQRGWLAEAEVRRGR